MDIGRLMYKSLVNIVNTHIKMGDCVEFVPIRRTEPPFRGKFIRAYRNLDVDNGPAMVEVQSGERRETHKISYYNKFRILDDITVRAEYRLPYS